MDEIICPQCGRPNLNEAKKCWFCQTELVTPEEEPAEGPAKSIQDADTHSENPDEASGEEESENIPEWLRRVRQLKEADAPPEEETPDWEQTKLFNGASTPEKKKKVSRPKPTSSNTQATEKQPKKEQPPMEKPAQPEENSNPAGEDEDVSALSEDLPDGFIKI